MDGAFLEERLALVRLLQPFGNFVAIEVFGGLVEDGEQYEGDEAGIEVFLEFAAWPSSGRAGFTECFW
ncbi:MAG: hypothetical protein JWO04_2055 [Gammaproteobacteria bacterium]|nr:hypothetical protein [Gammaproteobacteria bacterium]